MWIDVHEAGDIWIDIEAYTMLRKPNEVASSVAHETCVAGIQLHGRKA